MGLQRAPIQKFLGLNTASPPYDLAPGVSPDLSNVRYPIGAVDQEALMQRKGFKAVVSGFSGGAPVSSVPMMSGLDAGGTLVTSGDGDIWGSICQIPMNVGAVFARWFDGGAYVGDYVFVSTGLGGVVFAAPMDTPNTPAHQSINPLTGVATPWVNGYLGAANVMKSLVSWRGRLVATGTDVNRIYYSDVGANNMAFGFLDIFDQTNSANIELIVHKNNLYLIKQDSVWMIFDPVTFANRLIAPVGAGGFQRRISVSNPYDQRLYWVNQRTGYIYSTAGEVDLVIENLQAPLPAGRDYNGSWSRVAYDPASQSTVVSWQSVPNGGAGLQLADRIDEIVTIFGKPGEHEIFRHKANTKMLMVAQIQNTTGAVSLRKALINSSINSTTKLYETLGQGGSDDNAVIDANWQSGWMPIVSEEPWERIRRVNFLYRGDPKIEITSSMKLQGVNVAPGQVITPAQYLGDGTDGDRTFVTADGPNTKGRFHKIGVRGPSAVGLEFGVSAVELAIRGGKEKK